MTTATTTKYSRRNLPLVGDEVIVVRNSSEPEITTVDHTTKTGWFRLEGVKCNYRMYGKNCAEVAGVSKSSYRRYIEIVPFTLDNLAEARKRYDERLAAKVAERAARDAKEAERQAQHDAETAIVRALVPDWKRLAMVPPPCPDGSRVYQHTFYNRPYEYKHEDGTVTAEDRGWVWVIITTKDVEEYNWKADGGGKKKMVEVAVTYRVGNSSSFSSCSTSKHDTEEEAVYEGLRYIYNSGW